MTVNNRVNAFVQFCTRDPKQGESDEVINKTFNSLVEEYPGHENLFQSEPQIPNKSPSDQFKRPKQINSKDLKQNRKPRNKN